MWLAQGSSVETPEALALPDCQVPTVVMYKEAMGESQQGCYSGPCCPWTLLGLKTKLVCLMKFQWNEVKRITARIG